MGKIFANLLILSFCFAIFIWIESEVFQRLPVSFFGYVTDVTRQNSSLSQENTAVILFADTTDQSEETKLSKVWPLPYSTHERLLVQAWCLGARSVFIDIGFQRDRYQESYGSSQGREVTELTNFANTAELFSSEPENSPKFENLRKSKCHWPSNVNRKTNQMAVFIVEPHSSQLVTSYFHERLVSGRFTKENIYQKKKGELPTGAYAVVEDLCKRGLTDTAKCTNKSKVDEEFEIIDTVFSSPKQRSLPLVDLALNSATCVYRDDSYTDQLWKIFELITTFKKNSWSDCPPVFTVTNNWVLGLPNTDLTGAINEKVVFLGSAIEGSYDNVQTQYHHELPGVYIHALATEQLLSDVIPIPINPLGRIVILAIASLITLVIVKNNLIPRFGYKYKQLKLLFPAAIGLALVLIQYYFLNWNAQTGLLDSALFLLCHLGDKGKDPISWLHDEITNLRNKLLKS